jgi:hypothetical protein
MTMNIYTRYGLLKRVESGEIPKVHRPMICGQKYLRGQNVVKSIF